MDEHAAAEQKSPRNVLFCWKYGGSHEEICSRETYISPRSRRESTGSVHRVTRCAVPKPWLLYACSWGPPRSACFGTRAPAWRRSRRKTQRASCALRPC